MAEKKIPSRKDRIQSLDKGPKGRPAEAIASGESEMTRIPDAKMSDENSDLRQRAEDADARTVWLIGQHSVR